MDVWEEDEADAFDLDHDVAVFADPLHESFVAGEGAAGYTDAVVFLKVLLFKYFAMGCVVCRKETEEVDVALGDRLDAVVGRIPVNPEGDGDLQMAASEGLEAQDVVARGLYEEHMRDDGTEFSTVTGGDTRFLGKEDLVAVRGKHFLGQEVLACADGEPLEGFGGRGVGV